MSSPFPILDIHPTSGLTFPWSEAVGSEALSQAAMGVGGVGMGFVMDIYWDDLEQAIKQILGYSQRLSAGVLTRNVPFKHPYFNQLWCTRISRILGRRFIGLEDWVDLNNATGAAAGGTVSVFEFARLGLEFSRPTYPILDDDALEESGGGEWNRFTDRLWQPSVEVLSRTGTTFLYKAPTYPADGKPVPGSPGQRLGKLKLTRTWYQIPEAGVYNNAGIPSQLFLQGSGRPRLGTINSATFFGCAAGTLLYDVPEITPQPLPMPAYLMGLGMGEFTAQLQYDVKFHFIYFDPPPGDGVTQRGHNLMPYAGDTKWYPVYAQQQFPPGSGTYPQPFETSDFTELFTIL